MHYIIEYRCTVQEFAENMIYGFWNIDYTKAMEFGRGAHTLKQTNEGDVN